MKATTKIFPALAAAMVALCILAGGCSRPKIIPDDRLESILTEIYLSNAYVQMEGVNTDTIDIYTPILRKYGYTTEDFKHTVVSFSKRKSSKLSDIIMQSRNTIGSQLSGYRRAVHILDTIETIASEKYREQVFFRDSIKVYRTKDTAGLRLVVPVREGRYRISYSYLLDTVDKNRNIRANHVMADTSGKLRQSSNHWYAKQKRSRHSLDITAQPFDKEIVLQMANYPSVDMKKPALRIDSIEVTYYPPVQTSLDMLYRDIIDDILTDTLMHHEKISQDSIPLYFGVRRVDPQRDSIGGR